MSGWSYCSLVGVLRDCSLVLPPLLVFGCQGVIGLLRVRPGLRVEVDVGRIFGCLYSLRDRSWLRKRALLSLDFWMIVDQVMDLVGVWWGVFARCLLFCCWWGLFYAWYLVWIDCVVVVCGAVLFCGSRRRPGMFCLVVAGLWFWLVGFPFPFWLFFSSGECFGGCFFVGVAVVSRCQAMREVRLFSLNLFISFFVSPIGWIGWSCYMNLFAVFSCGG